MLQAGLQEGGGLADPYTKEFAFTGADLASEPGYQFGLAEGQKAIEAAQRALGNRFSGGAVKAATRYATNYAGTKFNEGFNRAATTYGINENTFRQNQADRFNRLMDAAGLGLNATNNDANARLITGQQLADLEMARAEAEAAGDIGKANAITDAINGATQGLTGLDLVEALRGGGQTATTAAENIRNIPNLNRFSPEVQKILTQPAPTQTMPIPTELTGAALAGGGAALAGGGGTAAGLTGASLIPSAGTIPGGALTAPEVLPAVAPQSTGLMGTAQALLTNPWTAVVAAGIIGTAALLKSQAHWEANTWVQGFQNKFDSGVDKLNRQFHSAAQAGQLSRAEAEQIRNEVAGLMTAYEQKRRDFGKQGSDERKVADQSLRTFNQYYGVNGQDFLSKMDAVIAGLQ